MKKLYFMKFANLLGAVLLIIAQTSAVEVCNFGIYEIEMPEEVKCLNKRHKKNLE